jgi:hypothetical protein
VEVAMFVSLALLVGSFGVPRFRDAVERSKAGEAFHYLNVVRVAEARHHARFGSYTQDVAATDAELPLLKFFAAGDLEPGDTGLENSWRMTLIRKGPAAGYGAYTVSYCERGFDADRSTIVSAPSINPLGSIRVADDAEREFRRRSFAESR